MDILAATYENIGPFVRRKLSVHFRSGTYLITAPIGTGKSFLFFDGPVFGLYKHSKRAILNRASEEGKVQILFTLAEKVWLIERKLTPTKQGGESIRSRLFASQLSLHDRKNKLDTFFAGQEIVDETDLLQQHKQQFEEISFHSQRELDQAVLDLLPPKEATLSINFLLQDAPNVFELTPAERITIFKHLFGLLGIDEAKETLRDKKRDIQTTIKVKEDTQQLDSKLRGHVTTLSTAYSKFKQLVKQYDHLDIYATQIDEHEFLQDIVLLDEGLHVDKLQLGSFDETILSRARSDYEELLAKQNKTQGVVDQLTTQLSEVDKQLTSLSQQKKQLSEKLQKLDIGKDISVAEKKATLTKEKRTLLVSQEALLEEVDLSRLEKLGIEATELEDMVDALQAYKQKFALLSTKRDHLREQYRKLTAEKKQQTAEADRLEKQLTKIDAQMDDKNNYYCKLIEKNCPFLEDIKGGSTTAINEQREHIAQQRQEIEKKKLPALDKELAEKKETGAKMNSELEKLEKILEELTELGLEDKYKQHKVTRQKINQVDTALQQIEQKASAQQEAKEKKIELEAELKNIKQQQDRLTQEHEELKKKRTSYQSGLEKDHVSSMGEAVGLIEEIVQSYAQVEQLAKERHDNQLTIKQLKEQEEVVKQLYKIFSKELLFVVLQDFLPNLEEVINTYLAQLVEYTVRFYLPSSADEKMELTIEIHDEKGVREVKSLSGGQLMMLKLVWILAVGRLMNVQFLFLDETINNLDIEAIGRVARLLEDYVSGQDVKLYVVTHSPQIQQLDIWDQKIQLT